jgi:hypothetical protein
MPQLYKSVPSLSPGEDGFCSFEMKQGRRMTQRREFCLGKDITETKVTNLKLP